MMVDHLVASGESILALAWCTFSAALSVWHRKALAVFFPDQSGSLIKRLVIAQRRITDQMRASLLASAQVALLWLFRPCTSSAHWRTPCISLPAPCATLAARSTLRAPCVSSMRR